MQAGNHLTSHMHLIVFKQIKITGFGNTNLNSKNQCNYYLQLISKFYMQFKSDILFDREMALKFKKCLIK